MTAFMAALEGMSCSPSVYGSDGSWNEPNRSNPATCVNSDPTETPAANTNGTRDAYMATCQGTRGGGRRATILCTALLAACAAVACDESDDGSSDGSSAQGGASGTHGGPADAAIPVDGFACATKVCRRGEEWCRWVFEDDDATSCEALPESCREADVDCSCFGYGADEDAGSAAAFVLACSFCVEVDGHFEITCGGP